MSRTLNILCQSIVCAILSTFSTCSLACLWINSDVVALTLLLQVTLSQEIGLFLVFGRNDPHRVRLNERGLCHI